MIQKHKIAITNGQQIPAIKRTAQETGRNWYTLGAMGNSLPFIVDDTGRKGYEQYHALGASSDGEYFTVA